MTEPKTVDTKKVSTVRQFSQKHPAFPEAGLRHLIFHAEKNGFAKCIRRVGGKVILVDDIFFQVIEEQNQQGGAK